MEKRHDTIRLADNSGSVRIESINMQMFKEDVATGARDHEYVDKLGGEITIELWSNTKVVDFHIASKPIRSELYGFSTTRTLSIHRDLPASLNHRMKALFLEVEEYLGKSIERDLHERK